MPSQCEGLKKCVLIPSSFPMAEITCRQRSGCRWTMQRWALVAILAVLPGQGWRRRLRSALIFVTHRFRVVGSKQDMAVPARPGDPTCRWGQVWSQELSLLWSPCRLL